MTAGRWQEVERIYHSALDHAPDQRSAFLIEACAGDDELRSEVESLLAARTGKDSLIDDGGVAVAARLVAEPSQHLTGRKLGRYEVIRKLGSGGMGEVYLARDTRLAREVALKVLRPGSIDHTDRNRLEREAKAASALRHPNIVTVHDFDSCDGVDFIVMEYVPGHMLSEVIGKKGLPVREALGYAAQIADALIAAHAAGITHRDLKPANVIVDDSGAVKVLDFGLAKRAPGLTSETQSLSGGFVAGTAAYMSPEQAEGKPLDARTDIFSFGAVLYEFLVGTRAFERDSTAATIAAIMAEEPPSVKNVPPELDRIVRRCLRKDAARRFQTMADVKSALEDTRQELAPAAGTRKRRWISLTAAVVALGGAGILSWIYIPWQQRPEPQLSHLTSYPGSEYDPAFSPDGNQIAFVWNGEDQATSHIYVKLVGATDALRLTRDNRPERYPAWSRDGRWIAFNRRLDDGRAKIVITSALGGAERNIGELQACCSRLSWSADSKWLVTSEHLESNAGRLVLLDVETGEKRILLSPPAGAFGDYDPAFSPSGRAIAFVRNSGSTISSGIFVVRLSESMKPSAPLSRVTTGGGGNGQPAWTPDGREIVYVSELPGYLAGDERSWAVESRLWRVGSSGQSKPQQIAFTQDGSSQPSIAMNGHRLAYNLVTNDSNVWRIPIRSSPAAPAKVAASTRDEYSPSYSPDGSKLVFSSMRTGVMEIWICDADGSNPQQLTRFGRGYTGSPQFSPDGKRIAFDSSRTGSFEIYIMAADGGNPVQLTRMGVESAAPRWSNDGKRIYFESVRTRRHEIWMIPTSGGEPVQITQNGGYAACESPDGAELYYTKVSAGGTLWRMRLTGGPETKAIDNVLFRNFAWGKKALYYVRPAGPNTYEFVRVPYAGGAPEFLGKAESVSLGFALSPDERWLAYAKYDTSGSDLMLVEGFR